MLNVAMMVLVITRQSEFSKLNAKEVLLFPDFESSDLLYFPTCFLSKSFCAMRTACSSVSIPSLACSGDLTKGVGVDACQNACNIFNCCWEEKGCYSTHETECLAAMKHCNYISR